MAVNWHLNVIQWPWRIWYPHSWNVIKCHQMAVEWQFNVIQWRLRHIEMLSIGGWLTMLDCVYQILHGHWMTFWITFHHINGNNVGNLLPDISSEMPFYFYSLVLCPQLNELDRYQAWHSPHDSSPPASIVCPDDWFLRCHTPMHPCWYRTSVKTNAKNFVIKIMRSKMRKDKLARRRRTIQISY